MRTLFKEGRGINSSIAVLQDITGKAEEKAIALGVAVGSGYMYRTTFEKEVYSDLYGERGCLMGGIHGMFLAQYEVLRERGHTPSEAFNETCVCEYAKQSCANTNNRLGGSPLLSVPSDRKERNGLHVRSMQHDRPSWRNRLDRKVQVQPQATLQRAVRQRQERRRDSTNARVCRRQELQAKL